jgi:hypothetical protein
VVLQDIRGVECACVNYEMVRRWFRCRKRAHAQR